MKRDSGKEKFMKVGVDWGIIIICQVARRILAIKMREPEIKHRDKIAGII